MIFNERNLRLAVTLAEELHFRRAAEKLHISQPALSGAVKALEKELGVLLFRRGQRKVELTEAGRVFAAEARRLLDESMLAIALVRRSASDATGPVRIGYSAATNVRWIWSLASAAARDARFDPGLKFISGESAELCESIVHGTLDVAFLAARPPYQDLEYAPLYSDPLVAAFNVAHPLALAGAIQLEQLAGIPLVWLRQDLDKALFQNFISLCSVHGYRPNIVQEVRSFYECLQFAGEGLGVALLPSFMGAAASGEPVVMRPLRGNPVFIECALVYRYERRTQVGQFARFVQENLPEK